MNGCIFCKIIAREIPSERVYENEHVYAFLDIAPVHPGHTLVVPKVHAATLMEIETTALLKTVELLPSLAKAVMQAMQAKGCNLLQNNGEVAGQTVHHVHFHIIPRYADDGVLLWPKTAYASEEEARKIAAEIQKSLSK